MLVSKEAMQNGVVVLANWQIRLHARTIGTGSLSARFSLNQCRSIVPIAVFGWGLLYQIVGPTFANCIPCNRVGGGLGKVNRPTMFFYLAVATSTAKISLGRNVSIFMKRETLQKRHKQSNKHVFRVCMHSYMYITKVT